MNSKFSSNVLLMAILILAACAFALKTSAYGVTLKFAHWGVEGDPLFKTAVEFKNAVESQTNGSVKIEIYPANKLGAPPAVLESLRSGAIDISFNSTGQLLLWVKEAAALQFPFIFEDLEHAFRVLDGDGGVLLAKTSSTKGFKVLSYWDWGLRQVTNSRRPINAPEDMKGLKIRVPPELPMEVIMQALGVTTQKIAYDELYLALSQNVVDGQENPIRAAYYMKFYEHQKYIAVLNYMYLSAIHLMSDSSWQKLSEEERSVIQRASTVARDYSRKIGAEEEPILVQKLKDHGCVFTYPDPVPFQKKMDPAVKKISDYVGAEFSEEFLTAVKKYAKKDSTKTYIENLIKTFR